MSQKVAPYFGLTVALGFCAKVIDDQDRYNRRLYNRSMPKLNTLLGQVYNVDNACHRDRQFDLIVKVARSREDFIRWRKKTWLFRGFSTLSYCSVLNLEHEIESFVANEKRLKQNKNKHKLYTLF